MTKQRLKSILLCFSLITFMACEKDSAPTDNSDGQQVMEENDTAENSTENEDAIAVEQLNTDMIVNGAQKVDGAPPAPNGSLDFQIATDDQSGFLDTGFLINVSSSDSATGAYLLFTDVDGNKADSYFDINFEGSSSEKGLRPKSEAKGKTTFHKVLENETIQVVFNDKVPVGEFCYEICLYDAANNVSEIVKRCVVVEEWGGNSELVGSWLFDRTLVNGVAVTDAGTTEITCDDSSQIEVNEEIINKDVWLLVLEADGDYYEMYDFSSNELDFDATQTACDAIYESEPFEYKERFLGKWSFADSKLTIVDFAYEDLNDPSQNETSETGEVYFNGVGAEIVNGELILTESGSIDGQEITTKAIFKPAN